MSEENGADKLFGHIQQQAGGIRHLRRDCIDLTRMLACGAISQDKIKGYLEQTGELLGLKLSERDSRAVKRLWDVLLAAARLDQNERHKIIDKELPDQHHMSHTVSEVKVLLDELRADDGFLERQYGGAIPTNGHAGPHGYHGKPGQVGDGSAPPED